MNELLIVAALKAAHALGVKRISLNFAMFRPALERGERIGAGPGAADLAPLAGLPLAWFQIESLYKFNAKFCPALGATLLRLPRARRPAADRLRRACRPRRSWSGPGSELRRLARKLGLRPCARRRAGAPPAARPHRRRPPDRRPPRAAPPAAWPPRAASWPARGGCSAVLAASGFRNGRGAAAGVALGNDPLGRIG